MIGAKLIDRRIGFLQDASNRSERLVPEYNLTIPQGCSCSSVVDEHQMLSGGRGFESLHEYDIVIVLKALPSPVGKQCIDYRHGSRSPCRPNLGRALGQIGKGG